MKTCKNINFPELTFTSPGVYNYTIKEISLPDREWDTDSRVYRAIVTVTQSSDGRLTAELEYPDGFPRFVNIRKHYPPCDKCKYFECLPFPMLWFLPPQKPEFMELMKTAPHIFNWMEEIKNRYASGNL